MTASRRQALLDHLRRTVSGLSVDPRDTTWADYADATSYTNAGTASKETLVRSFLSTVAGSTAIDVGANTGRYSAIAVEAGYRVIALDGDWAAVERSYRELRTRDDAASRAITPLLADVVSPSPGIGWGNRERAPLLERLHADVALALALVHHLAIGRNVPLPQIADLFAGIAPHLVIEWVPKSDPMVGRLLAAREDVFDSYTPDGFRAAFEARFETVASEPIADSGRVLYLLRRR